MLERGTISIRQFTIIVALVTIGDSILILPSFPAQEARQDAWLAGLLGLVMGLLLVFLLSAVSKLYPHLTLIEYNEKILGRWLGGTASLLFLIYCFFNVALLLREIGDFMATHMLPGTPLQAIHILFFLPIVMGVRLGLESFTRASEIFFPWIILFFFVLVLTITPQLEWEYLRPSLAEGVKPVLRASLTTTTYSFGGLVVLLMIIPYVSQQQRIRSAFFIGASLGGIFLVVIITLSLLVLGADYTARSIYPSYALARKIDLGLFFRRVEAMLAFMWIMTFFIKLILSYYVFNLGLAKLFKLKEYRFLALPVSMSVVVFSLLVAPNITYYNHFIVNYWPYFDLTCSLLLPMLLLTVHGVRKKLVI